MSKRLFIGTLLPEAEQDLLAEMRGHLEPIFSNWWHSKLRWVKPEKLHTTWLFLGQCDDETEHAIKAALPDVLADLEATELQYQHLVPFANKSRPTALVLCPDTIPQEVLHLSDSIKKRFGQYCEQKEDRPFRPHLTILRFPRDSKVQFSMKEKLDLSKYLPLKQVFDHVSLVESHIGNTNEEYEVIQDFALRK